MPPNINVDLTSIILSIIGVVASIIVPIGLFMRAIVGSNKELQTSLNKTNMENATLSGDNRVLQTEVNNSTRRIDRLDAEQISLRKSNDDARIEYRKEIDSRDQTIKALKDTIDLQNKQIADLQSQGKTFGEQVKSLTAQLDKALKQRDQLQDDANKPKPTAPGTGTGTAADIAIAAVDTALREATPAVNITPGPDVGIAS